MEERVFSEPGTENSGGVFGAKRGRDGRDRQELGLQNPEVGNLEPR